MALSTGSALGKACFYFALHANAHAARAAFHAIITSRAAFRAMAPPPAGGFSGTNIAAAAAGDSLLFSATRTSGLLVTREMPYAQKSHQEQLAEMIFGGWNTGDMTSSRWRTNVSQARVGRYRLRRS